jgi:hypothetical protein
MTQKTPFFGVNVRDVLYYVTFFPPHSQIPTDGLVLRGWYTTITLAVYGVLTKSVQEAPPPPPQALITHSVPPPVPCTTDPRVTEPIVTNTPTGDWVQQHAQVCCHWFHD